MCQFVELTKRLRKAEGMPLLALSPLDVSSQRVVLSANDGHVLQICTGDSGEIFRSCLDTSIDLRSCSSR